MKLAVAANPAFTSWTKRLLRAVRKPLLILAGLGLLSGGVYLLWDQVRSRVSVEPEFLLDVEQINLTPPPKWIHSDIKAQVVREAGWGQKLSLLDERLTVKVAQAFALHPWIAKVQRVSKSKSTGLTVEVTYRQPAAMVEVAGGLLAIDVETFVLPSDDFTAEDARDYPRIGGMKSGPRGPVGTRWGDAEVSAAAQLAAALRDHWKMLHLKRILPAGEPGGPPDRPAFSLLTSGDRTVLWGHVPGEELPGEPLAADKIARLTRHVAENGSLDLGEPQLLRSAALGGLRR